MDDSLFNFVDNGTEIGDEIQKIIGSKDKILNSSFSYYSRNTLIGTIFTNRNPYFVKILMGLECQKLTQDEVESFSSIQQSLPKDSGLRTPAVIGYNSKLGIIILEYISIPTVSQLLRKYRENEKSSCDRMAVGLVDRMGGFLQVFHASTYNSLGDPLLYADFSPNNIMIDCDLSTAILIDPPRNIQFGSAHSDIAVSLFEITRTMMKLRYSVSTISEARIAFLRAYYRGVISSNDLVSIHGEEKVFFRAVCQRYRWFWRYEDWVKQLVRGAFFLTVLHFYRVSIMPLFHRREAQSNRVTA